MSEDDDQCECVEGRALLCWHCFSTADADSEGDE